MNNSPTLYIHAVLGGMIATIGLWMLMGGLSMTITVILVVVCMVGLVNVSPTVAHIWMWTTIVLGLESFAWPIQTMGELRALGPEPPLEEMKHIFTAVLFGVFSGVFWLTFAYGIYRKINPPPQPVNPPAASRNSKAKRKKNR